MRGGQRRRATMVEGGSSPKGAVGGGFTSGGVVMPPAAGCGQVARGREGANWHSHRACEGGREGGGGRGAPILKVSGGNMGRRGGGKVWGRCSCGGGRKRERGLGTVARGAGRPAPTRSQRVQAATHDCTEIGEAGDTDKWSRGHSNGWRVQNGLIRFKISNSLKAFKFF
jgi:hypothetical protein